GVHSLDTKWYQALVMRVATGHYGPNVSAARHTPHRCDGGPSGVSRARKNMSTELAFPEWQVPLQEAILDFRAKGKLLEIETVIIARLHLLTGSGQLQEQRALTDALSTIRVLKQ